MHLLVFLLLLTNYKTFSDLVKKKNHYLTALEVRNLKWVSVAKNKMSEGLGSFYRRCRK